MTDKVPCSKCDALILPSTAERTGGVCMACKQGIRESIEESKAFYEKQKEYDPYSELWSSLVGRVHGDNGAFDNLSKPEKIYFAVSCLDGEVYNGGMHQFFSNSSGEFYAEAIEGLTLLEATESLSLLRCATKILFGDAFPPKDRQQRWALMKQYSDYENEPMPEWSMELEKIDRQYWKDPDDLGDLLINYVEESGLIQPFYATNK